MSYTKDAGTILVVHLHCLHPHIYDSPKLMSTSRVTFDDLTLGNSCGVIYKLNCGDKTLLLKKLEIPKRIAILRKKATYILVLSFKKNIEILDLQAQVFVLVLRIGAHGFVSRTYCK